MALAQERLLLVLLLWSGLLLLSTTSGHLHSPDGEVNYRTTRSLATGNGYAIPPLPDGSLTRQAEDGQEYSQYGPLQPLLAVPLYLLGEVAAPLVPENWLSAQSHRLGSTVSFYRDSSALREGGFEGLYPDNPQERVCRIFVSFFNSIATWLTVLLLAIFSRRAFGNGSYALLLPFLYFVATYAWPHSRPYYTEVLATLFLLTATFFATTLGGRRSTLQHLLLGASGVGILAGLAVLARMDSVVATPGIAWIACHRIWFRDQSSGPGLRIAVTLLGILTFFLLASVLPLQNLSRFGSFLATGYADQPEGVQFSVPILHSLWIYVVSPGKGVFWYSPPLLAALLAWPAFFRKDRHLALGIALMVAGYVLVVGRWQNLGGWCWGPRHLFQVTPLLLLPLPLLLRSEQSEQSRNPSIILLGATAVWGVFVQVCGVLVDFMWPLDRYLRGLPPGQDTEKILSFGFYGPILHLKAWRLDRDPDWLLVDLWKSGEIGAQILALVVWITLTFLSVVLARAVYQSFAIKSQS